MASDEWLIGESIDGERQYIVHLSEPRILARVFDQDDPEGVLGVLSFELPSGQSLSAFEFYEEPPVGKELEQLLAEAGAALESYDRKLGIE